jgi:hypothetical protein
MHLKVVFRLGWFNGQSEQFIHRRNWLGGRAPPCLQPVLLRCARLGVPHVAAKLAVLAPGAGGPPSHGVGPLLTEIAKTVDETGGLPLWGSTVNMP